MNDKSKPFIDVYVASIPSNGTIRCVYNKERNEEIARCTSKKLSRQKYYAWKLLEHALSYSFGESAGEWIFAKDERGKWRSDRSEFSITHSDDVVAVAVSSVAVGVDAERFLKNRFDERLALRICTQEEKAKYGDRFFDSRFVAEMWTKKESIFKMNGGGAICEINVDACSTFSQVVTLNGTEYIVSVASAESIAPTVSIVSCFD